MILVATRRHHLDLNVVSLFALTPSPSSITATIERRRPPLP
jgi:hypothetical protein